MLYSYGLTISQLCEFFSVTEHVLRREVGLENLQAAKVKAMGALAQKAYQMALAGDKTMLIFLLKTRARWSEQSVDIDHKAEKEKEILTHKANLGLDSETVGDIHITIAPPPTIESSREYERNVLEADYQVTSSSPYLGTPDTE